MNDDKKQEFKLRELIDRRDQTARIMDYSIQRIDIVIIALSTSGIFLATSTLTTRGSSVEMKFAILFFCLSIAINLVSQFVAYYTSRAMYKVYDQMAVDYEDNPESFKEESYDAQINSVSSRNPIIHTMNLTSLILLFSGMAACLLYYYCLS